MPGVVGNRTGRSGSRREHAADVVGQTLRAFADRAVVDRVGPHRIHLAATATGAEGDHRPVGVIEFFPEPLVDPHRQFSGKLGITWLREPVAHRAGRVVGDCAGG